MYSRKELKKSAKKIYKKNYWAVIAVCFVLAFLNVEYGTSVSTIHSYSQAKSSEASKEQGNVTIQENHISNWDTIRGLIRGGNTEDALVNQEIDETMGPIFDSMTKPISFAFKITLAANRAIDGFSILEILILCGAVLLELAFYFLIRNAVLIGGKRFLLETRVHAKAKIIQVVYLFHSKRFWNPVFILLLKGIKLFLWSLTIVGGVVKYYEYYMIPFILAENPHLSAKAVFHLSKEMMRGNKWKTLLLQLSFIGWNLLTVLSLGMIGIFFVNGYRGLTDANLYMNLRGNIKEKQENYSEELNDDRLEGTMVYE